MKLASFSLVLFLFVYHLKLHSDGVLGDQTSAKVEANNCGIEKVNGAGFVCQRDALFSDRSNKSLRMNTTINRSKRNFIPLKRYWWNSKAIPYMLDKSLGLTGRKAFQAAINEFERKTCIRFTRHTNEKDYIWVHRGSGCFSATGRTGGKQVLSLGKGCQTKGVVIHELLHALGMMHEHCRSDRNQFIRINANNIKPRRFLFFTKPSTRAEYMSSGVLYSAGYFKGSSCLRFYYHMRTGGYLRVFIKEAVSKKRNPYVLIWEREGPQGNRWNVMEKSILGAMIKIYIEGIKSPTLIGFVAIDDIRISQGKACFG